jgi:hypothetical protein
MGTEMRRDPRVSGYAKAIMLPAMTPGYIRDLSRHGCQVAFMQAVTAAAGDLVTVRVIAEHDPGIPPFQIGLRVRWARPDGIWFTFGGQIEDTGAVAAFETLVDYYEGAAK